MPGAGGRHGRDENCFRLRPKKEIAARSASIRTSLHHGERCRMTFPTGRDLLAMEHLRPRVQSPSSSGILGTSDSHGRKGCAFRGAFRRDARGGGASWGTVHQSGEEERAIVIAPGGQYSPRTIGRLAAVVGAFVAIQDSLRSMDVIYKKPSIRCGSARARNGRPQGGACRSDSISGPFGETPFRDCGSSRTGKRDHRQRVAARPPCFSHSPCDGRAATKPACPENFSSRARPSHPPRTPTGTPPQFTRRLVSADQGRRFAGAARRHPAPPERRGLRCFTGEPARRRSWRKTGGTDSDANTRPAGAPGARPAISVPTAGTSETGGDGGTGVEGARRATGYKVCRHLQLVTAWTVTNDF